MNYGYGYPNGYGQALGAFGFLFFIVWLAVVVFVIYLWARILHKAGYSGWLALLMLVPLANIALLIWFAFSQWPLERHSMGMPSGYAPPPGYYPPQQPGYPQPPAGYPPQQHPGGYPPQQPGGYQPPQPPQA